MANWRKQKELLLGIEYPMDKRQKYGIVMAIRRREAQLEAEAAEFKTYGVCPKCHVLNTVEGKCSRSCS